MSSVVCALRWIILMVNTTFGWRQVVRVRKRFFFFQAEDGIRDWSVTGVQTCALPISKNLLIYWFDPEDESLIQQWAKEDAFRHFRLDIECIGGSPDEASSAYAKAHFAGEPKTFYYFTDAVFSRDCKHAYVVFVVRYA